MAAGLVPWIALAQNLAPNPSFELGASQPDSWELKYGPGKWESFGNTGTRGVSVTGTGDCGALWRTLSGIPVEPGKTYMMRCSGMMIGSWGGTGSVEVEGAGWRRPLLSDGWAAYSIAVVIPTDVVSPVLRVGQCGIRATAFFDDMEFRPALPVHVRAGGWSLGAGESLRTNRYVSETRMADLRSNHARSLQEHTAVFGGDEWAGQWYWDLSSTKFVTYRHSMEGLTFTNAKVRATLSYSYGGNLIFDASLNGQDWQEISRFSPSFGSARQVLETNLPAGLLPATEVFIRLRTTGRMFVNAYGFEAEVPTSLPAADGGTWFFENEFPSDLARPVAMADTATGHVLSVEIHNTNLLSRTYLLHCRTEGPEGIREAQVQAVVPALASSEVDLILPSAGAGENVAGIEVRDQTGNSTVLSGYLRMPVAAIRDDSFGARLDGPTECAVWWCDGTYKVGRERNIPTTTNSAVTIAAARHEYEPFQIVLRPATALSNVTLSVSDFVGRDRPELTMAATNIEVCRVEYVPVLEPTDNGGAVGDHPDPLIPFTEPVSLPANVNQPFWFTVYVPASTVPGEYEASVNFVIDGSPFAVPIRLRVFNFALPETTHTRTAYGLDVDSRWHNWATPEEFATTWDLYMRNFAKHRVSPWRACQNTPIIARYIDGQWTYDSVAFDQTMTRYVEEYKFNGLVPFQVPWGGGAYPGYSPAVREAYARRIQPMVNHLREKGWLDACFWYAFDEPQPSAISNVREGNEMLLQIAPGLRRLVTTKPQTALHGAVDIWVPYLTYLETAFSEERQRYGDEVWWYVATGPRAPWPNNFIDHPAMSHRMRIWLAQKYEVTGELYWTSSWWITTNGLLRNPWIETMSRHPTLGNPLGNGDGLLLYPPVRTPPDQPVVAGPINSLRWELVREAHEDGEYFWLLNQLIQRAQERLGPHHPLVMEAQAAREAALALAPSRTTFERGAQKLYNARLRLADAIEKLDDGSPLIVSNPKSKAVELGSSVVLRVESLGWPLPAYQWRLNGNNIPGATDASFALNDCGPPQTGSYDVAVYNSSGAVTSQVAQVEGYWSELPRIISSPSDQVRRLSESAVLAVTAVSANPLSFFWLRNGTPVTDTIATNNTITFTNLTSNHAGVYCVVVSNVSGVVTSAPAQLIVSLPTTPLSLVLTGASWRYHDRGVDLGTAWREPGFDDSGWSNGLAQLGYGEGDEKTLLGGGLPAKPPTVYFRHKFVSPETAPAALLIGRLLSDDGAVVYLNGSEVFRANLPDGPIAFATSALRALEGSEEGAFLDFSVPGNLVQPGTNVIAVEVHQYIGNTPFAFDPLAYWAFDEAEPPWTDSVGTNHFTPVGTQILAMPGKIAGCVSNSYSHTDHLRTAPSPGLDFSQPFTVGGWFACGNATDGRAACLEKTNEFALYYTGTSINRYRFEVNSAVVQDQTSIAVGQWRFVVGWFDGSNASIQVNNGTVYSVPASAPLPAVSSLVALKKLNLSGGLAADEVFVFPRVLNAEERTALYTSGIRAEDLSFDFGLAGTWGQAPIFLSSPASLARYVGDNAAFRLTAVSSSPLSYQWNFNDTPIPGATNSLLFLEGVTQDHAGEYTLTASNLAGRVTSPSAALAVVPRPAVPAIGPGIGYSDGELWFDIAGPSGLAVIVEASTNLANWLPLQTNLVTNGQIRFSDTQSGAFGMRFYRARFATSDN
jgi:hypothetical protein